MADDGNELIDILVTKGGRLSIPPQIVSGVTGAAAAEVGEKAKYRVTKYRYSNKPLLTQAVKDLVKWEIKVGDKKEELPETGEEIEIEIKPEWAGKEIEVMPHLINFNESIIQKTKVKPWKLPIYFARSNRGKTTEADGSTSEDLMCLGMSEQEVLQMHPYFEYQIKQSDETLFKEMRSLVKDFTGFGGRENAERMIDHFYGNTGAEYSSDFLNNALKNAPTLKTFLNQKKKGVIHHLDETLKTYEENINKITGPLKGVINSENVKFNEFKDIFNGKQFAVHGSHAYDIWIDNFEWVSADKYNTELKIEIYDHFGLDRKDMKNKLIPITEKVGFLNTDNLAIFRAWFVLQHMRGYKPFVTKMICQYLIENHTID